ncbi:MAG TPA: DUF2752 domain-containing protein [Blastocatellia bacterium]|jgi:hypothetical protein|nr:DUF2752 domain-containing protein [Blastocatellia bacterium]
MIELGHAKLNVRNQSGPCSPHTALNPFEYSKSDQAKYIALGLASSLCLITARLLQPSPRGVGTHEQLGLPPCVFLRLTGIPCPSCGLTTCFAHAARLNFYEAFVAQPFGLIIFCLTALSVPLSLYLIYSRVPWSRLFYSTKFNRAMYVMIVLYLLSWLYKIVAMKWLFPHD